MNIYIFSMGIAFGILLMVTIYNAVLYYYNREKVFLYYSLMQIGMMGVLFYNPNVIHDLELSFISGEIVYNTISLYTLFFIVMFTRLFLQIDTHLVKHSKILNYILYLILFDALFFLFPFLFDFGVYLFIFFYIVYLGYLRTKQGSKSARFYLLGWGTLSLFVFIDEFTDISIEMVIFNPMIIGSVLEAIILAIALAYQLNERKKEQIKQQQLLIHQSKLASMGEMLGNIAHQWRQPLTRLSYTLMNIEYSEAQKERTALVQEGTEQLEFMSQTINDFTDFYAPSKEKESFSLAEESQSILDFLNYKEIEIKLIVNHDATVYTYKNELKQVLLNLLSNAKDILKERHIKNPSIDITVEDKTITIQDNAGGIKLENIQQVFEPYFGTKESGLGIGLYMSKVIIEKNIGGKLTVVNSENGALFTIVLS